MDNENAPKRRRIIAEDEEIDEEVTSNPDDLIDNEQPDPEDDDGEDLLDTAFEDYVAAPELDTYEAEYLAGDDEVAESYLENLQYRQAADEEIEARNERIRRMQERDEGRDAELEGVRDYEREELEDDYSEDEEEGPPGTERRLNLDAFDCRLQDWISEDRTRREIEARLRKFLQDYYVGCELNAQWERKNKGIPIEERTSKMPVPKRRPIYREKIRAMCADNGSSLEVSYVHLGEAQSLLAIWLTDVPRDMLQIFDNVLQDEVLKEFEDYRQISQDIHVRITDLPISDRLRDLRQADLNNLVRVAGVVTRRTGVFPQVKSVMYNCTGCLKLVGPFIPNSAVHSRPSSCPVCQGVAFTTNAENTTYRNYQKITLQESPGSVPPGRVPRYKEVVLLGDLIDVARPGEEIDITGIYMHQQQGQAKDKAGFPVFGTVIEANCIQKKSGTSNTGLSDEDKRLIKELSRDPKIGERIIRSIAPSIYGHRHVKTAVALSLFGGCAKESGGGTHRVRGDINILLLGDPGTAKSQVLKYAEKTAPRSIYTTGKGASAVGLTAGVHRDPMTKEWTLEGGALVLADQGVCLIDEFDKMNEQDRTSIHEAMEQQTISVSKAGIVTSLQARCAVIAAANPIGGRYDPSYTLAENVELTDPILQRFDILCVLQDVVDPVADEQLANFVVRSHMRSHPELGDDEIDGEELGLEGELGQDLEEGDLNANGASSKHDHDPFIMDDGPEPLDQETLKKYIMYARAYVKPELMVSVDVDKISNLYADLRVQSAISGGVPIAVRHIESVMRMAQASARMHLREHVRDDDVDLAIKVMLESFLQAQKVAVRRTLQRSFRKYITFGEESNQLIMHQLQSLVRHQAQDMVNRSKQTGSVTVYMADLEKRAKDVNIYDLRPFYDSALFKNLGFTVDPRRQTIILEQTYSLPYDNNRFE